MFFDSLNRYPMLLKSKSGPQTKKKPKFSHFMDVFCTKTPFFEIIVTFKLITLFFRLYYMFFDLLNWLSISSKSKSGPQTKKKTKFSRFMVVVRVKLITLFFRFYFIFFNLLNRFLITTAIIIAIQRLRNTHKRYVFLKLETRFFGNKVFSTKWQLILGSTDMISINEDAFCLLRYTLL